MNCEEARGVIETPMMRKIFPIYEKDRIAEREAFDHVFNCDKCYQWSLDKIAKLNEEINLDDDLETLEDDMKEAKSREERHRVVSKYKESRRGQG